jgi:hypothetical protein
MPPDPAPCYSLGVLLRGTVLVLFSALLAACGGQTEHESAGSGTGDPTSARGSAGAPGGGGPAESNSGTGTDNPEQGAPSSLGGFEPVGGAGPVTPGTGGADTGGGGIVQAEPTVPEGECPPSAPWDQPCFIEGQECSYGGRFELEDGCWGSEGYSVQCIDGQWVGNTTSSFCCICPDDRALSPLPPVVGGAGGVGRAAAGEAGAGGTASAAAVSDTDGGAGEASETVATCPATPPAACATCESEGVSCSYTSHNGELDCTTELRCGGGYWGRSEVCRSPPPCPSVWTTPCEPEGLECESSNSYVYFGWDGTCPGVPCCSGGGGWEKLSCSEGQWVMFDGWAVD